MLSIDVHYSRIIESVFGNIDRERERDRDGNGDREIDSLAWSLWIIVVLRCTQKITKLVSYGEWIRQKLKKKTSIKQKRIDETEKMLCHIDDHTLFLCKVSSEVAGIENQKIRREKWAKFARNKEDAINLWTKKKTFGQWSQSTCFCWHSKWLKAAEATTMRQAKGMPHDGLICSVYGEIMTCAVCVIE